MPTNSQGLLPQATVTALFPATTAIKFRMEKTGSSGSGSKTWRALLLEDELYHPPSDTGWGDTVYTCTQPSSKTSSTKAQAARSSEATGSSSFMESQPLFTGRDPSSLIPAVGPGPLFGGSLTTASSSLVSSFPSPFMGSLSNIPGPPTHIWGNGGLGHTLGPLGPNIGGGPDIYNGGFGGGGGQQK